MKNNEYKFILIPQQVSMHMSSYRQHSFTSKLHIDLPILIGIGLLFVVSMLVLYSAKSDIVLLQKQAIRMLISVVLMIVVAHIPPRLFKSWSIFLYIIGLLILVLVFGVGITSKGAKRWIELGWIRFQPSELMKLAVPMMVAKTFHEHVLPPSLKILFIAGACIVFPSLLIALQPDLGTAILVASSGCLVIFFAGIKWRQVFCLSGTAMLAMPLFWMMLKDYQKDRILMLFSPENDPLGRGYQIIQSKIAIGSGGIYGKGWLNGTQAHLEYLPERTTDFVFAVFGEEFGLIGIVFLFLIYSFIIIRGLYIGAKAQDTFNRLLAGSISMVLFVYVFVNVGMVCGILPVVGVPLPLISYGGTSLVIIMISCGMLMSIQSHRILVKK
jgi:rod shape determining protein RodA